MKKYFIKKYKLDSILLISIILIIILIVMLFIYKKYLKDSFEKIFPPLDLPDSIQIIVNTPLKPLSSPLKIYEKNQKLPGIYIYDPNNLSPVRDQYDCGACWAFVITSMLSDDVTTRIINFGKNLSVQELLTCYPSTEGCEGADPEDALKWLDMSSFKLGISDEYIALDNHECKTFAENGIPIVKNSVKSLCNYINLESSELLVNDKILLDNIYNMKMQIRNRGPIYATISVYDDFFGFLGNEIYMKKNNNFIGGHAIEIIGWCDKGVDYRKNFNKYGYWVCKNSWGIKWANKYDFPGYFAIRMGHNECGIESRTGCADPDVQFILPDNKISSSIVIDSFNKLLYKIVNKNYINKYYILD